jgi:hypothetical protein
VTQAFLKGTIVEDIYIEQPEGFEQKKKQQKQSIQT